MATNLRMGDCPRTKCFAARIYPGVQTLHSHLRRGRGRLRGVPERSQATQQSLLQHAPAGIFHHSFASPRRRAARRRAGDGSHARRAGKGLRRNADAQTSRCRRRVRPDWRCFRESFVCAKGVADVLPVDVEVPGNPPPPLAILHGLLVAVGRKPPASLWLRLRRNETNAAKL